MQLVHTFMCQVVANAAGTVTATATIQQPQLQLWLTDAENPTPINVTNDGPTVEVGEYVTMYARIGGMSGTPVAVNWTVPGNNQVIQSYNESWPTNQLWQIGEPGVGADAGLRVVSDSSYIQFEWVAGGPAIPVITATIPETTTAATCVFTVQSPNVDGQPAGATATPQHEAGTGGTTVYGITPYGVVEGMEKLLFSGSSAPGWDYNFVQTVTNESSVFVPSQNKAAKLGADPTGVYKTVAPSGLDGVFPYGCDYSYTAEAVNSDDSPRVVVFNEGGWTKKKITVTTYYICEPLYNGNASGGWVPLAKLSWSYDLYVTWKPGTPEPKVVESVATVTGFAPWSAGQGSPTYNFTPTTDFPQWTSVATGQMMMGTRPSMVARLGG